MTNYDVLVVEDNVVLASQIKVALDSLSISNVVCGSFSEFEEKLESGEYKIFLLDANFPSDQGLRSIYYFPVAVQSIKKKYIDPKIYLYSSLRDGAGIAQSHGAGYFPKTTDDNLIAEELEKIIDGIKD